MFIIVTDSTKDKKPIALADRNLTKDVWWTTDTALIKIFSTLDGADKVKSNIKYNNPRVATLAWFKEINKMENNV